MGPVGSIIEELIELSENLSGGNAARTCDDGLLRLLVQVGVIHRDVGRARHLVWCLLWYVLLDTSKNKSKKGNDHEKKDNDVILKQGGFICDVKILSSGVQLLCRNHFRKMFQLRVDEVLLFQKLTKQEEVILSVFDYLNKK